MVYGQTFAHMYGYRGLPFSVEPMGCTFCVSKVRSVILKQAAHYDLCVSKFFCSAEPSGSPAKDNFRMNRYKNKALNLEEMRRRREEEGIQLRKQKREQQVTP